MSFLGKFAEWFSKFSERKIFIAIALLFVPVCLLWPVLFNRILGGYDAASYGVLFDNFGGAHNSINADPYYEFAPWFRVMRDSFREWRLPLWNEFAGLGQPLWANMQSAPFSVFTWLVLLFGFKWGIVLGSFAKLYIAGLGMWLWLRRLGRSRVASLAGGLALQSANFFAIWLVWPLTGILCFIPLGLYFLHKAIYLEDRFGFLKFALVSFLAFCSGHPQTFFYVAVFWGVYGFSLAVREKKLRVFVVGMVLSVLVLILLGAPILFPFLEYTTLSHALSVRGSHGLNPYHLPSSMVAVLAFPEWFGLVFGKSSYVAVPNFSEFAMGVTSLFAWLLALLCVPYLFVRKQNFEMKWLWGALVLCGLLVFGVSPVYYFVNKLPGFSVNYNNRLLYLMAFSVCGLVAFAVDFLRLRIVTKSELRRVSVYAVVFAVLFLALTLGGKFLPGSVAWSADKSLAVSALLAFQKKWLLVIGVLSIASLGTLWFVWKSFRKNIFLVRFTAFALFFCALLFEPLIRGFWYQTWVRADMFYPKTSVTDFLVKNWENGGGRVFALDLALMPEVSSYYGFNQLMTYDAIGLQKEWEWKEKLLGGLLSGAQYTNLVPSSSALSSLGVEYAIVPKERESEVALKWGGGANKIDELSGQRFGLWRVKALPFAMVFSGEEADKQVKEVREKGVPGALEGLPVSRLGGGEVRVFYEGDRVRKFLVLNQNYYPGWSLVDESGKKVAGKDFEGLLGFEMEGLSGSVFETDYWPTRFTLSFALMGVGVLVVCGWWVVMRRRKTE